MVFLKKQIIKLKLEKLQINLIIMIMINITTPEFNNLAADVFNVRLAQANPEKKADFDNTVPSLDSKITTNKTISVSIENLLKKLQTRNLI